MRCPRCESVVLDELDRSGVTVDRCSSCRGIWLDRGELEKLIARAHSESEGAAPQRPVDPRPAYDQGHYERPRAYDREPPSSRPGYRHGHKRRRSFWEDIFD